MVGIAAPRGDSETTAPLARIAVRDRSVATSGNSQRGWRIGGRWYSHIFDPRTGRPVERSSRRRWSPSAPRRRRPGHDLQRPARRGEPDAGPVDPGGRVPDRRPTTAASRPAAGWAGWKPPADPPRRRAPRRPRPRRRRRQGGPGPRGRGTTPSSCSSSSRSASPTATSGAIAGLTSRSGSRTRTGVAVRTLSLWVQTRPPGPSLASRPEAVVPGRPGPQAGRRQGPGRDRRPADPAARQVRGHLGRQGRPRPARRARRVHPAHRGRPRARDVSDHPQADDHRRQAVRRGTQGE